MLKEQKRKMAETDKFEIDRKFEDLDNISNGHRHYNPIFDSKDEDPRKTIEIKPDQKDLSKMADFLSTEFPIDLAHKYNFFGVGGMIKDAYDAYHKRDLDKANQYLAKAYSHLEKTGSQMPEELGIWVDRLAQKIIEELETTELE
jgi:hypothetical protein